MTTKKLKFSTAFIFALMFCVFEFNGIAFAWNKFYVKKGGNDSNDGLTWNTAFATITKAVNSAGRNDDIRVAAGTYAENIKLDKVLFIYGSYPADGGDVKDYEKNITTIDGQGKDRVIYSSAGQIVIDGFTITNGKTYADGGGICYNYAADISNCNFVKNSAQNGGGLACENTSAGNIKNCTFTKNSATEQGGGIYNVENIKNCSFIENSAGNDGGGVYEAVSDMTDCSFIKNTAANHGGGAYDVNYVTDCSFIENSAGSDGGGIYNALGDITNCTFIKNTAANYGGGVYYIISLRNCVFNENKAANGGGVYKPSRGYNAVTTIYGCTFDGNEATADGGGIRVIGSNSEKIEILNSTFTVNYAKRGGAVFLEGNGDLRGNGWKRIKHCTFVDNISDSGTELYTASTTVDDVINCIIWNADGDCIANKNKALLTFTSCAMDEDECVGENLDDDDIYDSMITVDLHPIFITDFTPSHSPETASFNGVEHTIFRLEESDTDLIHKGIALTFNKYQLETEFHDDQLGVSRNIEQPTVGAVEYQDSSSNEDYGGGNDEANSQELQKPQEPQDNVNYNSVNRKSSSSCNSGILIYGLVLVAGLSMKK